MDKFKAFLQSAWFIPFLRFCVLIALIFVLFVGLCGIWLTGVSEIQREPYMLLTLSSIAGLVINAR